MENFIFYAVVLNPYSWMKATSTFPSVNPLKHLRWDFCGNSQRFIAQLIAQLTILRKAPSEMFGQHSEYAFNTSNTSGVL